MNITVMNSEYVSSSLMKLFLSLFPPGWIKKERKDWEEEKKKLEPPRSPPRTSHFFLKVYHKRILVLMVLPS